MVQFSDSPLNRQSRRAARRDFSRKSKKLLLSGNWGEWRKERGSRFPCPNGLVNFWANDLYSVQNYKIVCEWGEVDFVGIRRNDEKKNIPWSDKQRVKNELFGAERTAIEVFPAESELVDQANMYWLYILPEGFKLPFNMFRARG
jgi:hypothetical protein